MKIYLIPKRELGNKTPNNANDHVSMSWLEGEEV